MSETDSDLDYASADEDTGCDAVTENSNNDEENNPDVNDGSSGISGHPPKIMSSASEIPNSESVTSENFKIVTKDVLDKNNADHVNELSAIKDCSKDESSKDSPVDKPVEEKSTEDNCSVSEVSESIISEKSIAEEKKDVLNNENIEDNLPEIPVTKLHEKQRVPLRLEKKLQQKQQASKEDNDEIKTTEVQPQKPEAKVYIFLLILMHFINLMNLQMNIKDVILFH